MSISPLPQDFTEVMSLSLCIMSATEFESDKLTWKIRMKQMAPTY